MARRVGVVPLGSMDRHRTLDNTSVNETVRKDPDGGFTVLRAKDWREAFELIKQATTPTRILFHEGEMTTSGQTIKLPPDSPLLSATLEP